MTAGDRGRLGDDLLRFHAGSILIIESVAVNGRK
jgi:hypothetical protein